MLILAALARIALSKRNLLFIGIFLLGTAFCVYASWKSQGKDHTTLLAWTYSISFVVALILRMIFLVRIPSGSVIVISEKYVTHAFDSATWLWRKEYAEYVSSKDGKVISYGKSAFSTTIETRGDHPLCCKIDVFRKEDKKSLILLTKLLVSHRERWFNPFEGLAEYLSYEFVEENRDELNKLFNPADAEQQERYLRLLERFLASRIGTEKFLFIGCFSHFTLVGNKCETAKHLP